jgi:hypothetical protein
VHHAEYCRLFLFYGMEMNSYAKAMLLPDMELERQGIDMFLARTLMRAEARARETRTSKLAIDSRRLGKEMLLCLNG